MKIIVYLTLEMNTHILKSLDDKCLKLFRNGLFGHFLDLRIRKISHQFFSRLIRSLCKIENPNVLTFNLEEHILEFEWK